jgi:hypothetical protein
MRRRMRCLLRRSVICFENIDFNHRPRPRPRWVEFGRLGSWPPADKLGGRAFDVLLALIEASGAVVGKDEFLSRVRQGTIFDENRQPGTRLPRCAVALAPFEAVSENCAIRAGTPAARLHRKPGMRGGPRAVRPSESRSFRQSRGRVAGRLDEAARAHWRLA